MIPPTKQSTDTLHRVFRGSGWYYYDATGVRASFRFGSLPSFRSDNIGFRCSQRGTRQPLKG